jgi:hypothetical protein
LGDAVRRSVRLSGDATACAEGPAQVSAGSGVAANVTITIDFACPAAMRTLLIRDDSFDVLGTDLHILARIEHDGTAEPFAFATEKREARVGVGTTAEARRGVGSFFALGIEHILTGYDHLLFLLALMIGGGSAWSLVKIVTAFTLAHSVTLTAAALDLIVLPGQVVEPAIALSIGYVAVREPLRFRRGTSKRWLVALVFGWSTASVLRGPEGARAAAGWPGLVAAALQPGRGGRPGGSRRGRDSAPHRPAARFLARGGRSRDVDGGARRRHRPVRGKSLLRLIAATTSGAGRLGGFSARPTSRLRRTTRCGRGRPRCLGRVPLSAPTADPPPPTSSRRGPPRGHRRARN